MFQNNFPNNINIIEILFSNASKVSSSDFSHSLNNPDLFAYPSLSSFHLLHFSTTFFPPPILFSSSPSSHSLPPTHLPLTSSFFPPPFLSSFLSTLCFTLSSTHLFVETLLFVELLLQGLGLDHGVFLVVPHHLHLLLDCLHSPCGHHLETGGGLRNERKKETFEAFSLDCE